MYSITINITNEKLIDKITWLLEHFKNDGLEIVSKEDMDDLKLLSATRNETSVPFDEYLNSTALLGWASDARSERSSRLKPAMPNIQGALASFICQTGHLMAGRRGQGL